MKSLDNGSCLNIFIQLYPQQHNMSHYGNLLFSMSKFMDKIVWAVTIILLQKFFDRDRAKLSRSYKWQM